MDIIRPRLTDYHGIHKNHNPRAGINSGQDKDGLKHDREVIPVGHHSLHERNRRENVSHADGERNSATRTTLNLFANLCGQIRQIHRGNTQFGEGGRCGVDREVVGRYQNAGSDQGHDGDKAFGQHGAIADEEDVLRWRSAFGVVPEPMMAWKPERRRRRW